MISKLSLALLVVFAFIGISYSCSSFAQESSRGGDNSIVIEEIIVTARFREEYLQDIGASIAAYGENQIAREGLIEVQDIALRTVGMDVLDLGPNVNDINIRGISNALPTGRGLKALATTFLDDVVVSGLGSGAAADFSVFRRVSILQPHVAFRSNWQRDQNRSRSRNVRASDVERIKEDVAGLFMGVFVERLEAAGYDVVNYADEDVLVLRPAIIDLDITAPDVSRAGRSRTYTANTGAATLFVELFDSLSSDLIGRALDCRAAGRTSGFATQANRVTNRADARREFRGWADTLIEFLDQHYIKAAEAE